MEDNLVYLDTYLLQQDMRIRVPKAVLLNLGAEKGITKFDIFFDATNQSLVMKVHDDVREDN